MDTKISVIIPVYNRENYIRDCIHSLQWQTYANFEAIIVDDGSTDQTLTICQEFAEADDRIVLVKGSHEGVSAARNKGLDTAKGKYLFFLDSDDVIHPRLLETLVKEMEHTHVPMSGSMCCRVSQKNWNQLPHQIENDADFGRTETVPFDRAICEIFKNSTPINMIGGVMIRTDWVGQTRFRRDLYIGEDFFFVYENLAKGADVIFLEPKWYYQRIHDSNSSWDFKVSGFLNRVLRRKLVWELESAAGREENAVAAKREVFSIFVKFRKKKQIGYRERKEMRKAMRRYRKQILPALTGKAKLAFVLYVYFPAICPARKKR